MTSSKAATRGMMFLASVVAGASYAARLVRAGGGFRADSDQPEMIGQIQIVAVEGLEGLSPGVSRFMLEKGIDRASARINRMNRGINDETRRRGMGSPRRAKPVCPLLLREPVARVNRGLRTALEPGGGQCPQGEGQ